jgi:2-keto-4-pentenoate hydratase
MLRPKTRAEGYAIQALLEKHDLGPVFGWKIAATSPAGQAHIHVDGPLAGRIMASRVVTDGGVCDLGASQMRVAELEFAFRMARDLPSQAAPHTVEEVLDAVETLHPAIELPDSRLQPFEAAGEAQLIADNACANLFVLGTAVTVDWRSVDLAEHKVIGRINDGPAHAGIGRNVLGDPRVALQWLANELSSLGIPLVRDQIVTTGTCVIPMGILPGDHVSGDFGTLGRVSITLR